jgi:hypothetical protein
MICKEPLKKILIATRDSWDRIETRTAVRANFESVIDCGTPALGAEVYGSDTIERLVYHTCKSKACPSCGHRATLQWQREQWASLPDIPFAGVVFTMPSTLWPIFQQNRHLLHDLPAVGAAVVRQWTKLKYGVSVLIMVIAHTFGGRLNFNSHLHILVSNGGLREGEGRWVHRVGFDKKKLMPMWRFAVITFLRESLKAGVLTSDLGSVEMRKLLSNQYKWWSVHVDHFQSKTHFLRYAGRYVRRPPIAQHRFEEITERMVQFWVKDRKLKKRVSIQCSPGEFVAMLGEHIPDRYRHSIRRFGLLAPRSKARFSAAVFLLLGQQPRPHPRRLGWAFSLRRDFGTNPLIDSNGQAMRWIGRVSPRVPLHRAPSS